METTNTPIRRIGFTPSYMTDEDKFIMAPKKEPSVYVDPTLRDLQNKIVEMTEEFTTAEFAKLSPKKKLQKILDYNMLVQVEVKLSKIY